MQGQASRLKWFRRARRVALALAVAGIAAPTAQAHYPDVGSASGNKSAGLVLRGENKAGIGEVATALVRGEQKAGIGQAATAAVRGEVKTDVRDVRPISAPTSTPESFRIDWRDAGIGVAGAFALALLGASAMLGLRRRSRRGLATA
jgi:hypothetical protein